MGVRFKALILDFDGVLADTEPTHMRLFQRVLAEEKLLLNDDEYLRRYLGLTDRACFSAVYRAYGRSISSEHLDALVTRKSRYMLEAIRTDVFVSDTVRSFVLDAAEHYRLAIASGALREEIELCLDRIGLLDVFEHITAAQDVLRGKPFPDPYVHCFAALASGQMIATDECLAIEDTPTGIRAAKAAGLYCVGIATTVVPDALTLADVVAPSLEKMDLGHVARRLIGGACRSPESDIQMPHLGFLRSFGGWESNRPASEAQCRNSSQPI